MKLQDPRGSLRHISDEMLEEVSELVLRGCTLDDIITLFQLCPDWMQGMATLAMETASDVAWSDLNESLQRYIVFMDSFHCALRDMKSELFERVYLGKSNYASAAWLLSRKFPDEYGFGNASGEYSGVSSIPTSGDRALDSLSGEAESSGEIQLNSDAMKDYEQKINEL